MDPHPVVDGPKPDHRRRERTPGTSSTLPEALISECPVSLPTMEGREVEGGSQE